MGLSITALAMIVLLGFSVFQSRQIFEHRIAERHAAIARAVSGHVGSVLRGLEGDLLGVRQAVAADPTLLRQGAARLAARLGVVQSWNPDAERLDVYDATLRRVASTHDDGGTAGELRVEEVRARLRDLESPALVVAPPPAVAASGADGFAVAVAIWGADGGFLGFVEARLSAARLFNLFAELVPIGSTRLTLVHRDGRCLLCPAVGDGAPLDALVHAQLVEGYPLSTRVAADPRSITGAWLAEERPRLTAYALVGLVILALNVMAARRASIGARDQARAVDALARSESDKARIESRFAATLDSLADGFVIWGADGRLVAWNQRYADIVRRALGTIQVGDHIEDLTRRYARALPIGRDAAAVEAYAAAHIESFWSSTRPQVMETEDGRYVEISRSRAGDGSILSIHRDVTEVRRTAEALRVSEALLRDAIESLGDGITIWDAQDRLVLWNRRIIEMSPHLADVLRVGVRFAELCERATVAAQPDLDAASIAERVRARLDRRGRSTGAVIIDGPDGQLVEVVERRTEAGGLVCVYHDVTLRHRHEMALAASERLLHDALESIDLGIILYDADGRVLRWNSRFVSMFPPAAEVLRPGLPAEELVRHLYPRMEPGRSQDDVRRAIAARVARFANPGGVWERVWADGRTIEVSERRIAGDVVMTVNRDVTAERAALARHAQSEARFRDGIDSMEDGFALYDSDDRLVTWNKRLIELMPHAARHYRKGRGFVDVAVDLVMDATPTHSIAQREAWISDRLAARARGEPIEFETPEGRVMRSIDRRTSDGGHVVVVQDVTEHRRLLLRISESEATLRDAIASMADAVAVFDAESRIILWNAAFAGQFDVDGSIRVGATLSDIFLARLGRMEPGLTAVERNHRLEQRLAHWRAAAGSRHVSTPEGRHFEVSERRTAVGGTVVVYRDITDQVAGAVRLAQSEKRFRDFAESASDWFWETDADLRITDMSIELDRHGTSPEFFLGRRRSDVVRALGGTPSPALLDIEARMERHEVIRKLVYEALDPGAGERRTRMIEVSGRPHFDDDGRFVGYRGSASDVTERERQKATVERALAAERETNQQQRRFISIASHEFRTPLAIIDGSTQRIAARLKYAEPEILQRLQRIRRAVARMTEIIDRTLSTARLDEGRIEFDPRLFDLAELLDEACDRQRQMSPGFEIALACPDGPLEIEADPRLVDQVLTNLLSNAVKYSGKSTRVDVAAAVDMDAVSITVADRGVGIPAVEIPKLFTRFFRASTAEGISGTGIGLNLVRELVAMHGGTIEVASEPGVGTVFTVRLPRRSAAGLRPAVAA